MEDLTLDRNLRRGNRGKKVRLIQEWLSLHGVGVAVAARVDAGVGGRRRASARAARLPTRLCENFSSGGASRSTG